MSTLVRPAQPADVAVLVDLMHDFHAEAGFPLEREPAAASFRALLMNRVLGGIWLAQSGGDMAGYVVLTLRHTMEHGGLSGYVDDLYVRPPFRRSGIGRALLAALFDDCRARSARAICVEAGTFNTAAVALYADFGLAQRLDGRGLLATTLA